MDLIPLLAAVLALGALLLPGALPGAGTQSARAAGCLVTTLADMMTTDGSIYFATPGSLRTQLADPNCGTITFQPGLTGTIPLWMERSNCPGRPGTIRSTFALPEVTRTVSVIGPGASKLFIDRGSYVFSYSDTCSDAAFIVGANGHLTLSGVTVTGGNRGIALTDSTIDGSGAGLYLDGGTARASAERRAAACGII